MSATGSFDVMLKESILFTCGAEGVEKFNVAGYKDCQFFNREGRPDFEDISKALYGVFTQEQATVIAGDFTRRVKQCSPKDGGRTDQMFVKYFSAPPDEVKGLVLEARKMRAALGKEISVYDRKVVEEEPADPLEREIYGFVYGRWKHNSIDIMDFTRYLRDKGYLFKECVVLEKIYKKIDERNKENKKTLEKNIVVMLEADPDMSDASIKEFIESLAIAGFVYDHDEVRRIIRDARLRTAS